MTTTTTKTAGRAQVHQALSVDYKLCWLRMAMRRGLSSFLKLSPVQTTLYNDTLGLRTSDGILGACPFHSIEEYV